MGTNEWPLEVSPSCWFRRCHPETCCCNKAYVVHTYKVLAEVDTEKEGEAWIEEYKQLLKEKEDLTKRLKELQHERS